ncbi:MAG: helix-turn-helix domain-containing protein [Crocinitomicaceae bacterium]|nr:helix-turn-helix domain-containing protein [Crocinitomicaceae bacterium]
MNEPTFDQLPKAVLELYNKLNSIENLLIGKSEKSNSDEPLTIQQASEMLRLSVPTIYGYVSRNEIPFSKRPHSKRLWFSKAELTEWLMSGKQKAKADLKGGANSLMKKRKS